MWWYMGENQWFIFFVLVRNCFNWCFGCMYICSFAPMATRNTITPAVKEIITQLKEHFEEHYDGVVSRLCDQTIGAHECIEQRWHPLLFPPRNNVCACFPVVKTRIIYVNTFLFFVTCPFQKIIDHPTTRSQKRSNVFWCCSFQYFFLWRGWGSFSITFWHQGSIFFTRVFSAHNHRRLPFFLNATRSQ